MIKNRIAFNGSGYNKQYLFTHPWVVVVHYWRELKYFVQRGLYGYSDSDWWGLDYYLSQWMPSALRRFKRKGHLYPGYGLANTYKKWGEILEKMAQGFEASEKIGGYAYKGTTRLQKLQKQQKEGLKLFIQYFDNLWD